MIRALVETETGPIIVLGLSRENTRRLHKGQPIPVSLHEILQPLPRAVRKRVRGTDRLTILICAGETEEAIARELAETIGVGKTTEGNGRG